MKTETTDTTRSQASGPGDRPRNQPAGAFDGDLLRDVPWDLPGELPDVDADTSQIPNGQLEGDIVFLVDHLSSATVELLVLVGEYDVRGTYRHHGALSCAAWLASRCDIELVTAHNHVRVAKAMRTYPLLAAAMAAGDISYSKARTLVPHLSPAHAADLIELASRTSASDLSAAIDRWSRRDETPDRIDARHHDARSLTWRCDADGMIHLTARLEPDRAAGVCAVIDKIVSSNRPGPGDADRAHLSLRQQRADALVAAIVDHGSGRGAIGKVETEVVIHVAADGTTLADGTPLSDNAVTRLLPDSFVSLLLADNARKPIDASPRRRFPTRRQRRVVDAREGECAEPGCHARALLEYDHKVPFAVGGDTVVDNLQRLCGPHNRAKYEAEQAAGSPATERR